MSALPFHLMPGPKGLPVLGNILAYTKFGKHSFERLHLAKMENFRKYGPIYRECLGPGVNTVQLFNPDDMETVFREDGRMPARPTFPVVTVAHKRDGIPLGLGALNGEEWYEYRRSIQRLMMHPRAASVYLPAQSQVADDFLSIIQHQNYIHSCLKDLDDTILHYTMESIGVVCFDTRLGCLGTSEADSSLAERTIAATTKVFQAVQITSFTFPWYAIFRTPIYKQFIDSKITCDSIAHDLVKEAEKKCSAAAAVEEDEDAGPNFLQTLINSGKLTRQRIAAISAELFIAGIDSTANALSFVMYHLGRNKEAQEHLYEEIMRVCPPGQPVTQESFDRMPYMKACLKESFRLTFPVEGGTTRILQKDIVLGGYLVPKGTLAMMNNQTLCMLEEHFPKADCYLPERWVKGDESIIKTHSPFIMLPFGHGSRMCIGRRFAEQEIYLAMIKIFGSFEVKYEGQDEIGMLNRVFTKPDRPLNLSFTPRPRSAS